MTHRIAMRTTGRRLLSTLAVGLGALALAIPAHAGTLRWSGDVDDTATIYISRRDVRVDANLRGVRNENHDVHGGLPARSGRVSLDNADGRGHIRIIQQPRAENGYTAVVEIHDGQPGRGHYAFTLRWDDGDNRDWDRDRYGRHDHDGDDDRHQ